MIDYARYTNGVLDLRQIFRASMEPLPFSEGVSTYRCPTLSGIWPDDGVRIADYFFDVVIDLAGQGKLLEAINGSVRESVPNLRYLYCLNCRVSLTAMTAMQAVVGGKVVKPLCRGCWKVWES